MSAHEVPRKYEAAYYDNGGAGELRWRESFVFKQVSKNNEEQRYKPVPAVRPSGKDREQAPTPRWRQGNKGERKNEGAGDPKKNNRYRQKAENKCIGQ
jgi:hypothetical protein